MGMNTTWKKEVNHSEVMYYLEEMIDMDLADETERGVYYDLKYTGRCYKSEYTYVQNRIREWQQEKF